MDAIEVSKPEVVTDRHKLLFPYAAAIFGNMFETPCTADFEVIEDNQGITSVKINSLTAESHTGIMYDMEHLIADEFSEIGAFIVDSILNNRRHWDWSPEEGSESKVWW